MYANNTCPDDNELETEDGEIDERSSVYVKPKEDEIENYYLSLNELGRDLRCSCCGDVYSDPVQLKCLHLIDRSCAVIKRNGNVIECFLCHSLTICDDVDDLKTNFDVASRIPPKPDSLIAIINKQSGQFLKDNHESKIGNIKNVRVTNSKKRKRRTRWDKINTVPTIFNGSITDILSSQNLPKNITISQFKKFTEISNTSSARSLLSNPVLQTISTDAHKRSGPYSDTEILEMIPSNDLKGLFEVERVQLILLYRDALNKGIIVSPPLHKFPKLPLLPTPPKLWVHNSNASPLSYKHCSSSESSDSDCSDKMSIASETSNNQCPNFELQELVLKENNAVESVIPSTEVIKEEIICEKLSNGVNDSTVASDTNGCPEVPIYSVVENKITGDNIIQEDSVRYRDRVNRLHSIYSSMYVASQKMKELQHEMHSADYQSAYKNYSVNYNEYQTLYSSLQTAISIDSVVTEKSDSMSLETCSDQKPNPVTFIAKTSCDNLDLNTTNAHNNNDKHPDSSSLLDLVSSPKLTADNGHYSANLNQTDLDPQSSNNSVVEKSVASQPLRTQIQINNKNKCGYLWISNLCKESRTNDMYKLFSKFGHVSKIKLFQYKGQTPLTFFSLIFMPNLKEAEIALRELQNTVLFNRPINIKMLYPPTDIP